MLSFSDGRFWELKEAAKWSLNLDERKRAVAELVSKYGEGALGALSEIKDTTAYDEIRKICIEAIVSAKKMETETGIINRNTAGQRITPKVTKAKSKKSKKSGKKGKRA